MALVIWVIRRVVGAVCFAVAAFFCGLGIEVMTQGRPAVAFGIAAAAFVVGSILWPGRLSDLDDGSGRASGQTADRGSDDPD